MKVLVTGVTGQLGHDVAEELGRRGVECLAVGSREMDLTDAGAVRRVVESYRPDAVIHCAAYTAVDKAEDDADRCLDVNGKGTLALARAAADVGAKVLYISTDYVFHGDGEAPFEVDAPVAPVNLYGLSKLFGEQAVQMVTEKYFIVRISWVFGKNGNNFVKTMLRLGAEREEISVVADQWGSPTYTKDLAPLLCDMIETEKYGVYHATNEGVTCWADFAQEIMRAAGLSCQVRPIPSEAYPTRATRPKNSRLSKKSLDAAGFHRLPSWQDALERYLGKH